MKKSELVAASSAAKPVTQWLVSEFAPVIEAVPPASPPLGLTSYRFFPNEREVMAELASANNSTYIAPPQPKE